MNGIPLPPLSALFKLECIGDYANVAFFLCNEGIIEFLDLMLDYSRSSLDVFYSFES